MKMILGTPTMKQYSFLQKLFYLVARRIKHLEVELLKISEKPLGTEEGKRPFLLEL